MKATKKYNTTKFISLQDRNSKFWFPIIFTRIKSAIKSFNLCVGEEENNWFNTSVLDCDEVMPLNISAAEVEAVRDIVTYARLTDVIISAQLKTN